MDAPRTGATLWEILSTIVLTWSVRTTTFDWMTSAIGRFQPGTLLQGRAHAEESYREAMLDAKCLLRTRAFSKQCESPEASLS